MIVVDACGHQCPVPSLRLRSALAEAPGGTRAELLATDPMARIDVPFLMQELGGRVLSVSETDGVISLVVESAVARPD
jgi:tRNA 2-thiouridine synthesizing protein A